MNMECDIPTYSTKDWIEAALLLASHVELSATKKKGAVWFFEFKNLERSADLVESYWHGDLKVNLRDFVDSQRRIKDMLHRAYGNGFRQ